MDRLKAVGVIRVSTAQQADEDHFGIPAQRAAIQKLVAQHNLDLIETISYSDVSGADVIYAPEMQRLLKLIERPDINAVVAPEFSRVVRPTEFSDYALLQRFVDCRVTLYLPSGPLDFGNPHGKFIAGIQAQIAGLELSMIKSRLVAGREESRKLGYAAAGGRTVPTGVIWDVKTKTYSYDTVYAPVIREAFRMVANGETCFQKIIDTLQLKLRPARGEPKLAHVSVFRRLLENRMYVGERVIDKKFDPGVSRESRLFRSKDGKLRKKNPPMIPREPHEVYEHQVIEPGLVSREIFERVQQILRAKSDKRHQQHARRTPTIFAYRGLLLCAECGSPLYTVGAGQYSYYRCRNTMPKLAVADTCKSRSLHRADLDAALDRFFSQEFTKTQFFRELLLKHSGSDERKARAQRREYLKAQLDALAKKRERIIEFALEGTITKLDRDRRLRALDAEVERIRREIGELTDVPMPTYDEWTELLRPFRRGFPGLPSTEKRRLITSRFQDIRVKDYRVASLYLLTGEPADFRPQPPLETHCDLCRRPLNEPAEAGRIYCDGCQDTIAEQGEVDRAEMRQKQREEFDLPLIAHPAMLPIGADRAFAETSQGL